jgi:hypothetical protein
MDQSLISPSEPSSNQAFLANAKKLQNRHFKLFGVSGALVLGVAGFTPSLYHFFCGKLWSVSHDAPHTEVDAFLWLHAGSMLVWFCASSAQFITGGTKCREAHRVGGYVGFAALSMGMSTGAIWTVNYDAVRDGDVIGAAYTLLLVVCCVSPLSHPQTAAMSLLGG